MGKHSDPCPRCWQPCPHLLIISGGQTGVDQAGLRAAQAVGVPTGGWAPRGYLTLKGPDPLLGLTYRLREHTSDKYPPRTYANVKAAHATITMAHSFETRGEKLTRQACIHLDKGRLAIKWYGPGKAWTLRHAEAAEWLLDAATGQLDDGPFIINVAGNAEEHAKGIGAAAERYLRAVLKRVKRGLDKARA